LAQALAEGEVMQLLTQGGIPGAEPFCCRIRLGRMQLLILCATTWATATASAPVRLQAASKVPGWSRGPRASPDDSVDIIIAFKNRRSGQLAEEVLSVSSPDSARYGQHLTKEEISALTSPLPEETRPVEAWLAAAGLAGFSPSSRGDRIELRARVSQLEELFSTRVHHLIHEDGLSVLQAGDLHAPSEVAAGIAAVFGLHGTPLGPQPPPESPAGSPTVTPSMLSQLYGITGVNVSRGSTNRRATAEFQGQYTMQKDLSAFFKKYVPDAQPGDEVYTCFPEGACEPPAMRHASGIEAMLDVEYIMGAAPGIKTEVWTFIGMQWCTDLKNWTSKLLDHDRPPLVFSVSYGVQGNVSRDRREGCNDASIHNIEEDFMKIAARGVSLVFSSGDDGSGGTTIFKSTMWPVWPGSAPHVTAVGATQLQFGSSTAEEAVSHYGSGGGFSWFWPQQGWQQQAVDTYLRNPKARLPDEKDFPRGGRATPDVAALGVGYQVLVNGETRSVGGTSASAPLFAGMVSLLNEYRIQNGKSPLGFLNPMLYDLAKGGKGFKDITKGTNRKDRSGVPLREGYSCTEGWDAVTGWGTPIFGEMLEYVKGLPSGRRGEEVVV